MIRALALDADRPVVPVNRLLKISLLAGAAASLLLFALLLQPRPDIASALSSPGFCLKVAAAACLALTGAALLDMLARPTPRSRSLRSLTLAPLLLAAGVAVELAVIPSAGWRPRLIGSNATHCLALIPLLSAGPAAFLLLALRRAAPASPGLAGAVVGLASGGLGAILYALTCPDDSPLFVATWYSLAIAMVSGACCLAGRRWLTW
ncbi:MAG TPA: NrsF family protein [Steroidobacteraceae bacterium]|nr:NrsF family protein [Steroidobacteraceae bacterium]